MAHDALPPGVPEWGPEPYKRTVEMFWSAFPDLHMKMEAVGEGLSDRHADGTCQEAQTQNHTGGPPLSAPEQLLCHHQVRQRLHAFAEAMTSRAAKTALLERGDVPSRSVAQTGMSRIPGRDASCRHGAH